MRTLRNLFICLMLIWSPLLLADPVQVTIPYVGPTEGSVWMGIQQGIDEANLQGEFLGQKYTLKPVTEAELDKLGSVTAILVAADADTVLSIANHKQFADVPVLNLTSDDDKLRSACLHNLLSITASHKMKQDALAQWQKKHPDTPVTVRVWHKDFVKFAASQLNIRYSKAHGVSMDDDAWAGWAAVKLISDTVARTQNPQPDVVLNYLHNDIAFDGQKGDGATFRPTGQLRQIVLLVDSKDKIVAEAPLRGSKGGLDSLGMVACPK